MHIQFMYVSSVCLRVCVNANTYMREQSECIEVYMLLFIYFIFFLVRKQETLLG